MEFLSILAIAFGLSADCFAVAVGAGISREDHSKADVLKVSSSFGLFQALMPVLGWLVGRNIVSHVEKYDHWIAFALLVFVGGRMLWESFHANGESEKRTNIARWGSLLLLSIATSIDALAVGLSFAFLEVNMVMASLTIGMIAFAVTATGFYVGKRSRKIIGKPVEIIGAFILIGIGLRILLSHTL